MKLEIKNPILRWLAGCGLMAGIVGVVGMIFWGIGWLADFIPGFYNWFFSHKTAIVPFDLLILGFITTVILILVVLCLVFIFSGANEIGNRYFTPKS